LKLALYEAIELPEMETACIHVSCGPYDCTSKVVKVHSSRAIFNEDLTHKMPRIMSSDNFEDIPDIFLYLAKSDNATDRICFKRIKAIDLLDVG
jgi:hypothetical protein